MSSKKVLPLYKALIREAEKFSSYNYRNYALRRIRDTFKINKLSIEENKVREQVEFGYKNLEIIKRQVIVGNLYSTDKLVIENIDQRHHLLN